MAGLCRSLDHRNFLLFHGGKKLKNDMKTCNSSSVYSSSTVADGAPTLKTIQNGQQVKFTEAMKKGKDMLKRLRK
jgi:hypothetical protein